MDIEDIELAKALLDRIKRLQAFKSNRDEPMKLMRCKDDVVHISGQLRAHSRTASRKSEDVLEKMELANGVIYSAINLAIDDSIKILKERATMLGVQFPKEPA